MNENQLAIEAAISEISKVRTRIVKIKARQVRSVDDVALIKATSQTWFHNHRKTVANGLSLAILELVDESYSQLFDATGHHTAKSTYLEIIKNLKLQLLDLRSELSRSTRAALPAKSDNNCPDFSPLVGNMQMRDILTRRWGECAACVNANAHMAAIVMMGGLLEALFVARANKLVDKSPLINAKNAPVDKSTGKTINYQEWMLDSYIRVGRELDWITESAKDISDTIKEYRNFIYPAKELRYGITLGLNDSSMFWEVTKAIARQLLLSA